MSTPPAEQFFVFGPFLYAIGKALEIIAKDSGRETHPLPVADWAKALGVEKTLDEYHADGCFPLLRGEVDEEYALTCADLSVPVIVADIRAKRDGEPVLMLIDGTHRLRRAFVEGVESLPAYVLTFAESRRIRSTASYGMGRRREFC